MIYQPTKFIIAASIVVGFGALALLKIAFDAQARKYEDRIQVLEHHVREKSEENEELRRRQKTATVPRHSSGPAVVASETITPGRVPATGSGPRGSQTPPKTGSAPATRADVPLTDAEVAECANTLRGSPDASARHEAARRLLAATTTRSDDQLIFSSLNAAVLSDSSDQIRSDILGVFIHAFRSDLFDLALERLRLDPSPTVRKRLAGELVRLTEEQSGESLKSSAPAGTSDESLKTLIEQRRTQARTVLHDQLLHESEESVKQVIKSALSTLER